MNTRNLILSQREKWTSENCVNVKTGMNGSEQYDKTMDWIYQNFQQGEFAVNVFTIDEHTRVWFLTPDLKSKFETNFKPYEKL